MSQAKWMEWVRALQALSQTGLHYTENRYDRERYEEVRRIAAEILAAHSNLPEREFLRLAEGEFGYATPKVDVRGVVFRDSKVLLIREIQDNGRWTVPGGWADVNETPSEAVAREVFEESGFKTRVERLLAVYDREKQGHVPPLPFHVYKIFFLCEITGGEPRPNEEASEVAFFDLDALPELSVSRVNAKQLLRFHKLSRQPPAPADFD